MLVCTVTYLNIQSIFAYLRIEAMKTLLWHVERIAAGTHSPSERLGAWGCHSTVCPHSQRLPIHRTQHAHAGYGWARQESPFKTFWHTRRGKPGKSQARNVWRCHLPFMERYEMFCFPVFWVVSFWLTVYFQDILFPIHLSIGCRNLWDQLIENSCQHNDFTKWPVNVSMLPTFFSFDLLSSILSFYWIFLAHTYHWVLMFFCWTSSIGTTIQ